MPLLFICYILLISCGNHIDFSQSKNIIEKLQPYIVLENDFSTINNSFINIDQSNIIDNQNFYSLEMNKTSNDEYIQTNIDLAKLKEVTFSLWIKTYDISEIQTILWQGVSSQNGWGNGNNNFSNSEFNININHFSNQLGNSFPVFYGYNDSESSPNPVNFPYDYDGSLKGEILQLKNNQWYYISLIMKKSLNSVYIELYVNGNLLNKEEGYQVEINEWDEYLRIGRPGVSSRYFKGEISNLKIFNKILEKKEIQELYKLGK